jgi:sugar phosphate isomerase/epimerase
MNLGFRTTGFREWSLEDAFRTIAEIGYAGIELCMEDPLLSPKALNEQAVMDISRMLAAHRLEAAAVSYHGEPLPLATRVAKVFAAIRIAAKFPRRLLIISSDRADPDRRREQYDALVETVDLFLRVAVDYGVTLAIEPEPDLVIGTTREALALLGDLGSKNLKVNLDAGHCHVLGEKPEDAIKMLGAHIASLHIEDMVAGTHVHLVPGHGEMNFTTLFSTLKQIGYTGDCIVDIFNIHDDPARYARECFQHLAGIVREAGL